MDGMFESGKFFLGCNYWASHAGMYMWRDWDADVVERDFTLIEAAKVTVLRVFPLWPDFQPLYAHRTGGGGITEYRYKYDPLPFTEEGRAAVDPVMIERFRWFCDCAQRHNITFVVGLLTGWMSGERFVPPAFDGVAVLTDPAAIRWELRFVRYMVKHFKYHPAIGAWDLGNECNCLGANSADAAYVWTAAITNAIKLEDPTRPVVSGLHGTFPEATWCPQDMGELLDIQTTHPYPVFTPHCGTDPLKEMKSLMHATAESLMYEGVGGVPCFVEEIGTIAPTLGNEETAGDYVRGAAFNAWVHDLRGFVWWCAHEQIHLERTPYDWCDGERELGMLRVDGSKKPVGDSMTDLAAFTEKFVADYGPLPRRITDAVCILSKKQDHWAVAYGAFMMAKQAGLDLTFAYVDNELPEAEAYMLPVLGTNGITRHTMLGLMAKVEQGATLYISVNNITMSPFDQYTGFTVLGRERRINADSVTINGERLDLWSDMKLNLAPVGSEVLLENQKGEPVFGRYKYGKGKVYFLNNAPELAAGTRAQVISGECYTPYHLIYGMIAKDMQSPMKAAAKTSPFISITEHDAGERRRFVTLLNCRPETLSDSITLSDGWKLEKLLNVGADKSVAAGTEMGFDITLSPDTGAVAVLCK